MRINQVGLATHEGGKCNCPSSFSNFKDEGQLHCPPVKKKREKRGFLLLDLQHIPDYHRKGTLA
jgi:hypothetical protein